jgi:pimeloyl-ACP methyl ester carboxylesterase
MKYRLVLAILLMAGFSVAQSPVDREEEIFVGGIRQFITIQGNDPSLPLFLMLHGGPGGSVMSYSDRFTDRLKQHFLVVQWDQRETGRTLQLNRSPEPLSVALFENDTRELIEYLLKRYHRDKLYLAGHSWGTALGFRMAQTSPDRLYAYVAIGPMINQLESERMALEAMKEQAVNTNNATASTELAQVSIPFENGDQLYFHRKWLQIFFGSRKTLAKTFVEEWAARWLPVFNEASANNLLETLPSVECPVYFFVGKKDLQTNSRITEQYFQRVKAPKKDLFWFDTGHSIPAAAPARMQEIIIENILPETFIIQKPAALISTH